MTVKGESDRTIEAMENPVEAIFDLTEDVSKEFPSIMNIYIIAVILGLLIVLFSGGVSIYLFLVEDEILYLSFGLFFIVFGIFLIWPVLKWNKLIHFFNTRYNAIKAVRYSDPVVPVPPGETLTDRYLTYLWYLYPKLQRLLRYDPYAIKIKSNPDGGEYYFDAYILKKPSLLWRWLGLGDKGYGFYIKSFDRIPSMQEIIYLESRIVHNSRYFSVPPSRAVALFRINSETQEIDEGLYNYFINHPITVNLKQRTFKCPIQAVIEMEDNSYDFIPLIPAIPYELP